MPSALDPTDLIGGISPDNNRLLVRSGKYGNVDELALYEIVNPCNPAIKVTDLLSKELQQSFAQNPDEKSMNTLLGLQQSNPISWSTDSSKVLFPAALYGKTSDIVLFDPADERIDSLELNYQQDVMPSWNPSTNWVIYQGVHVPSLSTDEIGTQLFAMDLSNPVSVPDHSVFPGSSPEGSFAGWLTGKMFMSYTISKDEIKNLRLNDVNTGESQVVFSSTFKEISLDSKSGRAALIVGSEQSGINRNVPGIYYLSISGDNFTLLIPGNFTNLEYSPEVEKFLASNGKEVVIFDETGETQTIANEQRLTISPNGKYYIGWGLSGARLYTSDGKLIRTITKNPVTASIWQPSTKGFYLLQSNGLYQYVLPSLQGKLVTQDVYTNNEDTFVWLRGY